MPDVPNRDELTKGIVNFATEATYVAVGMGVLGLQKLQARRVELERRIPGARALDERISEQMTERIEEIRTGLGRHADQIDDALERVLRQIDSSLEPLEAHLPPPARELAASVHAGAHEARALLKDLLDGS